MIDGLATHLFRMPVRAGKIVAVFDHGQRLKVQTHDGESTVEIALSRGMATLKEPRVGHYLLEYPTGHIDVMDPVTFAAKQASGGADVH